MLNPSYEDNSCNSKVHCAVNVKVNRLQDGVTVSEYANNKINTKLIKTCQAGS